MLIIFYYSCLTLQKSVNRLIEMIHLFITFSGIKMYFSKSEAMSLRSQQQTPRSFTTSPLKWSLMGFVYLGIFTTSQFDQMFKAYLFNKIKQHLELYNSLPMSWLHGVSLLKINVLPHLLYQSRMIQIEKTLKNINESFIWSKRWAIIKKSTLQLHRI